MITDDVQQFKKQKLTMFLLPLDILELYSTVPACTDHMLKFNSTYLSQTINTHLCIHIHQTYVRRHMQTHIFLFTPWSFYFQTWYFSPSP